MSKLLTAAAALLLFTATTQASAESEQVGECLLEYRGVTYLDSACTITMETDGSFTIGVGTDNYPASTFFAYVFVENGVGYGSWNGPHAESKAHNQLGYLSRRGACWTNTDAKVCAWKAGTR
jgi:hypothetical protein